MQRDIIDEDLEYIINSNVKWEKFKCKTILITGANGLLPAYLVYTLLHLNDKMSINCKVIGLVRNIDKATAKFSKYLNRDDFKIIVNDICTVKNIDNKIDFIFHAASQASPIYYNRDPVGTINANVIGTNNMLKIARENKVESFLYFSSGEVYGELNENNDLIEEWDFGYLDPTNIRSCYAESKRLGETMCVSWADQFKVPAKIVRPFHTYGPGINFNDGRVFGDFVADLVSNRDIIIKSDGRDKRSFCYIADATIAFFLILLEGKNKEAYNVGNINGVASIYELAETLVNIFPEKKLKVIIDESKKSVHYLKSQIKSAIPSIDKIGSLGWNPKYSIEEGFKRTILSYIKGD